MQRRSQGGQTREALLDAAAEEFARFGFGGTRIQDILERADVTKGGLYHHFTSKLEVAQALVEDDRDRWADAAAAADGERGLAAIGAYGVAVISILAGDVRSRAVARMTGEVADAGHAFGLWRDFIMLALQQAVEDGDVPATRDVPTLATAFVDALYGAGTSPAPGSHRVSPEARGRQLVAVLCDGVRARTNGS